MRINNQLFLLSILLLFLVACGKAEEEIPSMTGKWSGGGGGAVVNVTVNENDTEINGSGNLAGGSSSIALTVSGTNVYPNVSLTLSSTNYAPINFTGRFSDSNTIDGKLNGSGFNDLVISLVRQ